MAELRTGANKMIYTPDHHIPIGEALTLADGEYALRIKKPKSQEVEIIRIGKLLSQVATTAETRA